MSREQARELRRPAARPTELELDEEIDVGRYAGALAARWWLPLLGLLAGVAAGYLLAVAGTSVYRAQALVDLGNPQVAVGGGQVQSVQALAASAREVATSEAAIRRAAAEAGIRAEHLRRGLQVQPVATGTARTATAPLLTVTVQGSGARRVADAANALAREVVRRTSQYVDRKIASLRAQVAADREQAASLVRQVETLRTAARQPGLSTTERLLAATNAGILEQQLGSVRNDLFSHEQQLAQAQYVERARVLERAVPVQTTARSVRASIVVGGALGLLLGILAALVWEPVAAAAARRR